MRHTFGPYLAKTLNGVGDFDFKLNAGTVIIAVYIDDIAANRHRDTRRVSEGLHLIDALCQLHAPALYVEDGESTVDLFHGGPYCWFSGIQKIVHRPEY